MTDNITNQNYITITATKVMVGGEKTTKYRGVSILWVSCLPRMLKEIQTMVKSEYGAAPIEMHVLSSETSGFYSKPGNPLAKHGLNAWVQFVFKNKENKITTPWVFIYSHSSSSSCAGFCAYDCGSHVRLYPAFRSGVFGSVADAIKSEIKQPIVQVKSKVINQSGDVTTMEIDFDNKKLQFQINAKQILESNSK